MRDRIEHLEDMINSEEGHAYAWGGSSLLIILLIVVLLIILL